MELKVTLGYWIQDWQCAGVARVEVMCTHTKMCTHTHAVTSRGLQNRKQQ